MALFWWISGVLVGLIWVWHTVEGGLGLRHVARVTDPEWDLVPGPNAPLVSLIVPALNEAATIEPALLSLVLSDYPNYEIVAVNDRSTDATGEIMDRVAREEGSGRLKVVHIAKLPPGWLGKTHAMWRGAQEARGDWLLFTDADIVFRSDALRRAIVYAERECADHLVVFPTMTFKNWGEKMVLAFFQIMFGFGHRPWKVADQQSKEHVGMGAFNLVRRNVYEAVGTHERLRLAVIDDIKLGELIKHSGYAQRNVFGRGLVEVHWATGAFGILHNLTKNFFALTHYNLVLAAGATLAMLVLNLLPFAGAVLSHGWSRAPFLAALIAILLIYVSIQMETGVRVYYFLLHPIAALLLAYAMLRSAFVTLKNGGVTWRGTRYSLDELRKGLD